MNGRQIEIFHAVMRAGTVTEAAQRLGITQPAVTASLKQIEAGLGFNLFHRASGRLHPTAEARILYNEAERIQDSLGIFNKLAQRLKKDLTMHLRIATPPAFSHALIPETISRFVAKTRHCIIDVTTQHHEQILKDISSTVGQNNLGFTFGLGERWGLGSVPVGTAQVVALVPLSWDLAGKSHISVRELAARPLIGTFAGEPLGNAVENLMNRAEVESDSVIRVHTHSVAASLVSKGVGATIIDSVTAAYAQNNKDAAFQVIPIDQAPAMPVTAVFSYEHPLNRHAKQFVDIFRQCFRDIA